MLLALKARRAVVVLLAALSMLSLTHEAEAAPRCRGDYCSGQYPDRAGCADASTRTVQRSVLKIQEYDYGGNASDGWSATPRLVEVGELELRYSPTCGTVWARAVIHVPTLLTGVLVRQELTGYTQQHYLFLAGTFSARRVTGTFFSKQIYTRGYRHQAFVQSHEVVQSSGHTRWW